MKLVNVIFAIFWFAHIPFMIFSDYTPNGITTGCAFFLSGLGCFLTRGESQ